MFSTKAFLGESDVLKGAFGATAVTLDVPAESSHILRIENLRRILYKVMADNNLDALVYPYNTIPPQIIVPSRVPDVYNPLNEPRILKAGTKLSDPNLLPGETTLKTDLDTVARRGRQLERQSQSGERLSRNRRASGLHSRGLRPRGRRERS